MRLPLLSLALCLLLLFAVRAQDTESGGGAPQLPVGQTFKQFEFPDYEDGKLKATFYAEEAKGITLNRAEATNLTISIFDTNSKGDKTVVTSPNADLYVAERKMRTKNTVQIENSDTTASSQECDFDLKTKKYLLRTNVKVILKHFDLSTGSAGSSQPGAAAAKPAPLPSDLGPASPHPEQSAVPPSPADSK